MGAVDAQITAGLVKAMAQLKTRWPEQAPQTRPAFLDQAYGYNCGGSQGYISGQGLVNTTLTVVASADVGSITVASATGIVANMGLTIVNPTSPLTFPLAYQNVIVASVAGSVVTLSAPHTNQQFPIGSLVVSTWLNDTHLNYWPSWVQWMFDTRLRSALTGLNLLTNAVGNFTTWTGGSSAIPDGWSAVGSGTFLRTQYSTASLTANARQNAANSLAYAVQVTAPAAADGMRNTTAVACVAGQRLVVNLLAKRVTAAGTNDITVAVVDGTTNAVLTSKVVPATTFGMLVPMSLPLTVPSGTTGIKVQVTGTVGNGGSAAAYISDVRVLADRQDTSSNLRSIRDPGTRFSVVTLGDSWGVNAVGSGGAGTFLAALQTFYGAGATLIDSSVSGNTLAQQLVRLPGLLNGTPRPSAVVHLSGFMNDGTGVVSTAALVAQVQQMVNMCRDSGVPLILLGVGPRNSDLAAYMARNESIRAVLDTESASLFISDATSLASVSD